MNDILEIISDRIKRDEKDKLGISKSLKGIGIDIRGYKSSKDLLNNVLVKLNYLNLTKDYILMRYIIVKLVGHINFNKFYCYVIQTNKSIKEF